MSKPLPRIDFDMRQARRELDAFAALLGEDEKKDLEEAAEILPFFKAHPHLAALIGCCVHPGIGFPDRAKPEYGVLGTHVCDYVVGEAAAEAFCVVEFEDAQETSVFRRKRDDRLPEWSPRLTHGFDQIVDWFCALDGIRQSDLFRTVFGSSLATFRALLVIGRRGHLDEPARLRLRYRSQKVQIDGQSVTILTYDDLRDRLATRLQLAV